MKQTASRLVLLLLFLLTALPIQAADPEGDWQPLFNGKNLAGWTPKIRGYELGDNFGNTFRVEDGLLKIRYDQYEKFDRNYGHLFYEKPYSYYRLRVEYRFVGEQVAGGPGWALRNSGLMLHGEDPKLMSIDQEFPTSIEVQLLGGNGISPRTTANLCTPGTNVVKEGKLFLPHCTGSNSQTYHGEQWVTCEVEVRGQESFKHYINGELVLEYSEPQLDERDEHAKELIQLNGGLLLKSGTISIQSESHPCDYRKIEIQVLEPSTR